MTGACVLGTGMVAAGVSGFSYLFARLYCKPKRCPPDATPAEFALPFEPVSFSSHGKTLQGWFMPARNKVAPWAAVVLAHGWSHNAARMLPIARFLHEAGFSVLSFDARGHGRSDGDGPITMKKIAEDILSSVRFLQSRSDVDRSRICVVGHSIGGGGGILAASLEPRIRALVSISAFANPLTLTRRHMSGAYIPRWPFLWLVRHFIESWLDTTMADIAPENRIGRVTAPVMLIHGDSDKFIPSTDMDVIYGKSNSEMTQRWLVPGRRHSDVFLDPGFAPRVVGFLLSSAFGNAEVCGERLRLC